MLVSPGLSVTCVWPSVRRTAVWNSDGILCLIMASAWDIAVYPAIQFVASTLADAIKVSNWNVPCHRHDYFYRQAVVWSGF